MNLIPPPRATQTQCLSAHFLNLFSAQDHAKERDEPADEFTVILACSPTDEYANEHTDAQENGDGDAEADACCSSLAIPIGDDEHTDERAEECTDEPTEEGEPERWVTFFSGNECTDKHANDRTDEPTEDPTEFYFGICWFPAVFRLGRLGGLRI